MRKLPPLSAVRVFEAAARHQNYTRAGEELGLTQAAVSYQIKSLEERVGAPLFSRNGRRMELTPEGAQLAPRISHAFSTMQNAFASLSEGSVLSIACFQTFATKFLAPRLCSFQIAHPQIAVRLEVADSFVDLHAGEVDIAIRLSHDVPAGLEVHELMPLEIAPFANPQCITKTGTLQGKDPDVLEDLRISPGSPWWRLWDEARCADRGKGLSDRKRGRLEFDSQILDCAAAMSGDGVVILSPEFFRPEVASGQLCMVGERPVRADAKFRLVYPEARRHAAKVKAFRDWFKAEFSKFIADGNELATQS